MVLAEKTEIGKIMDEEHDESYTLYQVTKQLQVVRKYGLLLEEDCNSPARGKKKSRGDREKILDGEDQNFLVLQ